MAQGTGTTTDRTVSEASALYNWSFGTAEFDEGRWQLSVDGTLVEMERKPLEVLQYLLRHAGEAVTKEELLSTVWEGRIVVEAVLTNAIGKLRKALGDDGQPIILTLPKVGYRLDAKVTRRVVEHVPEASRLNAGDTVPRRNNWQLEEALSRGGDGEVWLARHIKTGQGRVFKFSLDGQRLAGLKREVTVGRLLEQALGQRPDLVRVIDWDFEQAPYFVEFEYGGLSLDRCDEVNALPLDKRLALFLEATGAVAAAHDVGVLHKDLKPANLLVYGPMDDAHLRVADFGSSRVFETGALEHFGITGLGLTQTQAISPETGTPLYMAPEVLAGQSPSIKSDVYALGVTLYQLIVGDFRRPLAAGWESDVADPLLRQDIADAANGDPEKRLGSVAQLAERLRTLEPRRQKAALEAAIKDRIAAAERRVALARARRPWIIAVMVVLVAGMAASLFYAHTSRVAEAKARQDNAHMAVAIGNADALNHFYVTKLIAPAELYDSGTSTITLAQAWDRAEPQITASFVGHPLPEINLRGMLARIYDDHDQYAKAERQNARVVALLDATPTIARRYEFEYRLHDARDWFMQGKIAEMNRVLAPVRANEHSAEFAADPNNPYMLYSLAGLQETNNNPAQAADWYQKALAAGQRFTKGKDRAIVVAEANRGLALVADGRNAEGLAEEASAVARAKTVFGQGAALTLWVQDQELDAAIMTGKTDQAQHDLDSIRAHVVHAVGNDPVWAESLAEDQAAIDATEGHYAQALPSYATSYQTLAERFGPAGQNTLNVLSNYIEVARFVDPKLTGHLLDQMNAALASWPADSQGRFRITSAFQRACLMVGAHQGQQARALVTPLQPAALHTQNPSGDWAQFAHGLQGNDADQRSTCARHLTDISPLADM